MTPKERLKNTVIEPYVGLNKEGKAGVVIFAGGAALLGAGFIRTGYEIPNQMSTYGASIELLGYLIASHGHRRQKRKNCELEIT